MILVESLKQELRIPTSGVAVLFAGNLLVCICSEILRVVDSLQLTDRVKVATPVDWKVRLISL